MWRKLALILALAPFDNAFAASFGVSAGLGTFRSEPAKSTRPTSEGQLRFGLLTAEDDFKSLEFKVGLGMHQTRIDGDSSIQSEEILHTAGRIDLQVAYPILGDYLQFGISSSSRFAEGAELDIDASDAFQIAHFVGPVVSFRYPYSNSTITAAVAYYQDLSVSFAKQTSIQASISYAFDPYGKKREEKIEEKKEEPKPEASSPTETNVPPSAAETAVAAEASATPPAPSAVVQETADAPEAPAHEESVKVIHKDLVFVRGKTKPGPIAAQALKNFAALLNRYPKGWSRIVIYGNSDPTGTPELIAKVANERAQNAAAVLQQFGIAADRLEQKGVASDSPFDSANPISPLNRRLEIDVLGISDANLRQELGALNKSR